jgi:hypothetical protein
VISNCVVVGNASSANAGGVYQGTLKNCIVSRNVSSANGGGVYQGTLNNCIVSENATGINGIGGGAYGGTLNNCTVSNNWANAGGGAGFSTLFNCTLSSNTASRTGGGADSSSLNNCLITGNTAINGGGCYAPGNLANCTLVGNSATSSGGGVHGGGGGVMNNCIVYYNNAPSGSNHTGIKMNYCCTAPVFPLADNFTNAPLFVNQAAGDLRLQSNSPCINSGWNRFATNSFDLDGNPRITGGAVDIGAYEFQSPGSLASHVWLQQYGLPIDGSADFTDLDGDGMNNWQEWVAGTVPTNAASLLRLSKPSVTISDVTFTWPGLLNRTYSVERAAAIESPTSFVTLKTNITGNGTLSYTDTNSATGPAYYRVSVRY